MTDQHKRGLPQRRQPRGYQKQDPQYGLGYLDRASPKVLPRTFEVTKAWATDPTRRTRIVVQNHVPNHQKKEQS